MFLFPLSQMPPGRAGPRARSGAYLEQCKGKRLIKDSRDDVMEKCHVSGARRDSPTLEHATFFFQNKVSRAHALILTRPHVRIRNRVYV